MLLAYMLLRASSYFPLKNIQNVKITNHRGTKQSQTKLVPSFEFFVPAHTDITASAKNSHPRKTLMCGKFLFFLSKQVKTKPTYNECEYVFDFKHSQKE